MNKKIAFITDSKIIRFKNNYYSNSLSNLVWDRYLFDDNKLLVFSRIIETNNMNLNIKLSSMKNVSFDGIYDKSIKGLLSPVVRNQIKKIIYENDLIIIRFPSISGFIAVKECKKINKEYVIEIVGDIGTSLKGINSFFNLISYPLTLYTKKIIKNANNIIYVSKFFLQKKYPNYNNVLYCPDVYLEKPNTNTLVKRLKKIDSYKKNHIYKIGIVGSLNATYRGHKKLLEICYSLLKRGFYIEMHCIGSGESKNIVSKATALNIKDALVIDGVKSFGKEVFSWMDDIDILVMPTEAETLGRAIIEAMSRGCPVIGTLETAIPEQIGCDCIFSYKDKKGIEEHIAKMITNHSYMKYCAQENFHRSFKYCNEETFYIRQKFLSDILRKVKE